jgi:hypothetical protein
VRDMQSMFVGVTKNKGSKSFYRYGKFLDDLITRLQAERKPEEQGIFSILQQLYFIGGVSLGLKALQVLL